MNLSDKSRALSLELTISLCPIVENMAGSSVKLRPRLSLFILRPGLISTNCAQGSSVKNRAHSRSAFGRNPPNCARAQVGAWPVPKYMFNQHMYGFDLIPFDHIELQNWGNMPHKPPSLIAYNFIYFPMHLFGE